MDIIQVAILNMPPVFTVVTDLVVTVVTDRASPAPIVKEVALVNILAHILVIMWLIRIILVAILDMPPVAILDTLLVLIVVTDPASPALIVKEVALANILALSRAFI